MNVNDKKEGRMDLFPQERRFEDLPEEILEIIRLQQSPRFLDALALAALKPELTLELFTRYEYVFADTCARWIGTDNGEKQSNGVIGAFARILPLAPHLSTFLEKYLENTIPSPGRQERERRIQCLCDEYHGPNKLNGLELQRILLATFRLLSFDKHTFSRSISGAKIQSYLQHEDVGVRYLAVRIFCQLCIASESKLEAMVGEHVGKSEAVMGDFDGKPVDFGFLSLFEQKRLKYAANSLRQKSKSERQTSNV